jgi:hypothetical protein
MMPIKILNLIGLAFIVALIIGRFQEHDNQTARAESGEVTSTSPTPAPVRQYDDQQLQYWANADAMSAREESDLQPGSDHRFNWFEIGMQIADATETFVPQHGLNEVDADAYKEFFKERFTQIARAEERRK